MPEIMQRDLSCLRTSCKGIAKDNIKHNITNNIKVTPGKKTQKKRKNKPCAGCHIIIEYQDRHYSVLLMSTRGRCACNLNRCNKKYNRCKHVRRLYSDPGGKYEAKAIKRKKNLWLNDVLGDYTVNPNDSTNNVHSTIASGSDNYDCTKVYTGDIDYKYTALRELFEETSALRSNEIHSLIRLDRIVDILYVKQDYIEIVEDNYHSFVLVLKLEDFSPEVQNDIKTQIETLESIGMEHYTELNSATLKSTSSFGYRKSVYPPVMHTSCNPEVKRIDVVPFEVLYKGNRFTDECVIPSLTDMIRNRYDEFKQFIYSDKIENN